MIVTESYREQVKVWPRDGRHVLAQFDDDSVVVYQAYRRAIGRYAAEHGQFGGEFSFERMSWVKPNFLWMMYRSGWGTKEDQEVTLALRLRRAFFDEILAEAVPSSWDHELYPTRGEWSEAVGRSDVRLQWDPDHHPSGAKLERRAIQLGLRGETLRAFGTRELLKVIDLSEFVTEQRDRLASGGVAALVTPRERVYRPADPAVAARAWGSPRPKPAREGRDGPGRVGYGLAGRHQRPRKVVGRLRERHLRCPRGTAGDLAGQAVAMLREHGPVHPGSSFGDFGTVALEGGRGWVVTCHPNDILTDVAPDEVPAEQASDLAVGLLGRAKRGRDAEELRVVHVENRRTRG